MQAVAPARWKALALPVPPDIVQDFRGEFNAPRKKLLYRCLDAFFPAFLAALFAAFLSGLDDILLALRQCPEHPDRYLQNEDG